MKKASKFQHTYRVVEFQAYSINQVKFFLGEII